MTCLRPAYPARKGTVVRLRPDHDRFPAVFALGQHRVGAGEVERRPSDPGPEHRCAAATPRPGPRRGCRGRGGAGSWRRDRTARRAARAPFRSPGSRWIPWPPSARWPRRLRRDPGCAARTPPMGHRSQLGLAFSGAQWGIRLPVCLFQCTPVRTGSLILSRWLHFRPGQLTKQVGSVACATPRSLVQAWPPKDGKPPQTPVARSAKRWLAPAAKTVFDRHLASETAHSLARHCHARPGCGVSRARVP